MALRRRLTIAFALLASALPAPLAVAAGPPAPGSHVVVIVLENHEYGEVIGNPEMPFLNRLARRGALATHYYAIAHPSLPNYLALLGGSTFGIAEDCTDCRAGGANLASQLSAAGISWRAYMGGLPRPCFAGAASGTYAKRHNAFMYFPSITSHPDRCGRVVPEARLRTDLAGEELPSFSWLTPDLCADAHDCGLATADRHLAELVPALLRRLGPAGLLVLTFDEGTSDAGCCGDAGGGRVATMLLGPGIEPGQRLRLAYDHYSLLATLEDRFGLPRLRHARGARAIRAGPGQ